MGCLKVLYVLITIISINSLYSKAISSYSLKDIQDLLKTAYLNRSGFLIPPHETLLLRENGSCASYGETPEESLDSILKVVPKEWLKSSYFIDLGSGIGKTVVQSSFFVEKAIGIELSKTRITHAIEAVKKIKKGDIDLKSLRIDFKNENLLDTNLDFPNKNVFVFLCYTHLNKLDPLFLDKLAERFEASSSVQVIATLKQITFKKNTFKLYGVKKVAMSWSSNAIVYFYIRHDTTIPAMEKLPLYLDETL